MARHVGRRAERCPDGPLLSQTQLDGWLRKPTAPPGQAWTISFFGIGLLNLFYALSLTPLEVPLTAGRWGALSFALALVAMPTCCFLTAWRQSMRHLFPVPVLSAGAGIAIILLKGF
jgi:hypothetical protein